DVVAMGSGGTHSFSCGYYGCWYSGTAYQNVWLGKGDGTFVARPTVATMQIYFQPTWPPPVVNSTVTIGVDFNHDGTLDYAALDKSSGTVVVHLGSSSGPAPAPQTYSVAPNPDSVAAGDFDGDGWIDLIVVDALSSGKPALSVLLNDGKW